MWGYVKEKALWVCDLELSFLPWLRSQTAGGGRCLVPEAGSDVETIPTPVGTKDPGSHPRPVISSPREAEAQGASKPEKPRSLK